MAQYDEDRQTLAQRVFDLETTVQKLASVVNDHTDQGQSHGTRLTRLEAETGLLLDKEQER